MISRRPAHMSEIDMRRVLRAAKREGAAGVDILRDGSVRILPHVAKNEMHYEFAKTIEECEAAEAGYVYFAAQGRWVKIGFATNLERRIKALQSGNPERIEIIHSEAGTLRDEHAYHLRFATYRKSGEWFEIKGDLAIWLARRSGK